MLFLPFFALMFLLPGIYFDGGPNAAEAIECQCRMDVDGTQVRFGLATDDYADGAKQIAKRYHNFDGTITNFTAVLEVASDHSRSVRWSGRQCTVSHRSEGRSIAARCLVAAYMWKGPKLVELAWKLVAAQKADRRV